MSSLRAQSLLISIIALLAVAAIPMPAKALPQQGEALAKAQACVSPQRGSGTTNIHSANGNLQGYLIRWSTGRYGSYEVGARNLAGGRPNLWWRVWVTVGGTKHKYIDMYVADGREERRHPCLPENATRLHMQGCPVGANGNIGNCVDSYWPI